LARAVRRRLDRRGEQPPPVVGRVGWLRRVGDPVDAHGGVGGSACTGVVDAGAAEVVPWTRAAASAGRRARDSWTLDLRGADVHASPVDARGSGGGRRARKSWTLEPRRSACTRVPWTRAAAGGSGRSGRVGRVGLRPATGVPVSRRHPSAVASPGLPLLPAWPAHAR
jgi:hypothetical protein